MPFDADLVTLFQDASLGTFGTDIFASEAATIPFLPSGVISIRETGGTKPERTQNSVATPAYVNPSAQISVRAATKALALTKIRGCYNAVVGIRNVTIAPSDYSSYTFYREIDPLQEPFPLGVEERGQVRYAFNVIATKRL